MENLYAEVILPLALKKNYTYAIPPQLLQYAAIGKRAVVQFGRNKQYTALIYRLSHTPPSAYQPKYIESLVDDDPITTAPQLAFWQWIADYYMARLGDVMAAALPNAFRLQSETEIRLNANAVTPEVLSVKEQAIITELQHGNALSVYQVTKLLNQQSVLHIINKLQARGVISTAEKVNEKYAPLLKTYIRFTAFYHDFEHVELLLAELTRAVKQTDAVLALWQLTTKGQPVSKADLLEASNCGAAAIKALVVKEVIEEYGLEVSRLPSADNVASLKVELSPAQQSALSQVQQSFTQHRATLLFGVASSGKTHVYLALIKQYLALGGQILLLLPEIVLTTHIVERIREYFDNDIGVFHSKFTDAERVETWNRVLDGSYKLVVGARSAVFLPFSNLSLIVVDEEHDSSYKQADPAPRYNGRDAAVYLSHLHGAKILLCSATPAFETYYNALAAKYGLVQLLERFSHSPLPEYQIAYSGKQARGAVNTVYFTNELLNALDDVKRKGQQAILFQNRRGYARITICKQCGFIPKCISCDVSLVYHKPSHMLHCHYCGFSQPVLSRCPACGSAHIQQRGWGTQRIEEDLALLRPELSIARLDVDTTRTKKALQTILGKFNQGRVDVLIGTQMVAKGLDFNNVQLVGIMAADEMLNFPDYRASEIAYQLMSQVAGRAGRRSQKGKVIIQTYSPQNALLQYVIQADYPKFYHAELAGRVENRYPPVARLITLYVKHKQEDKSKLAASELFKRLAATFGTRVLGPAQPYITRIRTYYIWELLIKLDGITSISRVKKSMVEILDNFQAEKEYSQVNIVVDVDPL